MIKKGWLFLIFFSLLFTSCSNKNIKIPQNIEKKRLLDIPYVSQYRYYCGPSSLLMVIKYWQKKGYIKRAIKLEDIVKDVYIPSKKGTLQIELKTFARDNNLLYFEKRAKIEDILKLIDEGIAPIVLLNLAFKNYPIWHYAVVFGYDLRKKEIYLRSRKKIETLSFINFYNIHKKADFWTIVITPVKIVPKNITKEDFLKTAIELEKSKHFKLAIEAYKTALKRYKDDIDLLVGLANNYYLLKDYISAKDIYKKVLKIKKSSMILNNLALTYKNLKMCKKAKDSVKEAIKMDPKNRDIFEDTLNDILKDCR